MELILYTTHCPKCEVIENKLHVKDIVHKVVDNKDELIKAGIFSVPVLSVDGKRMGFLEANKYVNSL